MIFILTILLWFSKDYNDIVPGDKYILTFDPLLLWNDSDKPYNCDDLKQSFNLINQN